jgi:hypothetical protein
MEEMENVMIERLVQRQIKANERILRELGKIIGQIGELTPSEAYTLAQQLKYGESLEKIVKILSSTSELTEKEIYKMLEKEAKTNLALKKIYFKAKEIDYIPYEQNASLKNLVREVALATVGTYRNISMTTGLTYLDANGNRVTKGIREAYYEIVDNAIMNVNMGKESFWQAMKDELNTIGNAGVQSIEYESGYHRRIDSALRMNLSDGLSQLVLQQQELIGRQFGSNMVEVSHHANAAPDHIDTVDGKQFARINVIRQQIASGEETEIKVSDIVGNRVKFRGKWYEDFDYVNNNLARQVSTLNCYHIAFSGMLGNKPRYSAEELKRDKEKNERGFIFENKKYSMYEGEQLLRKIELEIRKARETEILARSSGQNELLEKMQSRSDKLVHKYYEVTKISGLKTRLQRIRLLTKS